MLRKALWLVVVLVVAASARSQTVERPTAPGELVLKHCLVTAVDDVQVPALRPGLLTSVKVKEGAHTGKDEVLAQLDDSEAQMQLRSATAERDAAAARAKSDLDVRYAEATHLVAEAEHKIAISVNEKQPNAVSLVELERLRLTAEQSALKIELGKFEQSVRETETGVTQAKTDLAANDVKQRQIRAPLEGEVAEIYVQSGEWIEAGKPVLRIVRLDRLRVEGFVHVRDSLPGEIIDRPVRVRVELARGERHEFAGQITYVSPIVQAGGEYRVWAEVENRQDKSQWLLRPGLEAEMALESR
jgi:macrolide-specific efflux system membrane fusion protein